MTDDCTRGSGEFTDSSRTRIQLATTSYLLPTTAAANLAADKVRDHGGPPPTVVGDESYVVATDVGPEKGFVAVRQGRFLFKIGLVRSGHDSPDVPQDLTTNAWLAQQVAASLAKQQ